MAGQGPGADDADQGVAGQGVGDGGHGPDGQVPPARRGGDRVHEDAGADRGEVEGPGAEGAAAVQGQGDAEAGEDQGGGVGDGGFQGGDGGQVAGGVGHPVLGGEADRGGGCGQDAQPGGRVAQPQAGTVFARLGFFGLDAGGRAVAARARGEERGRAGQGERTARCHGAGSRIRAGPPGDIGMTAVMARPFLSGRSGELPEGSGKCGGGICGAGFRRPPKEPGRMHRSVLFAVDVASRRAGADAQADHAAGQGLQLAVGSGG